MQRNEDSFGLEKIIVLWKKQYFVHPDENNREHPNLDLRNGKILRLREEVPVVTKRYIFLTCIVWFVYLVIVRIGLYTDQFCYFFS